MIKRWLTGLILLGVAMALHAAEPTVQIKVIGPQPAVVGQSVQVEVTILAPNYFMSAPAFPTLQMPGAVITMPDERGVNSTETIDGTSFAGIRKTYLFTPQTAGDFTLSAPDIAFTYAGDDGKPHEARVALPPTAIRVGGQQATSAPASTSASTLPATRLHITQRFDHPIDRPIDGKATTLKAGDALVRTITIYAPGTPAMMIAPPALAPVRGVKQYRADPRLVDGAAATGDEPAGTSGGRRVETITYVFEGSGRYQLPAVSVAWYDPTNGKAMQSVAPAVSVEIGRAASGSRPTGSMVLSVARWLDALDWRVLITLAALVALSALTYYRWRQRGDGDWRAVTRYLAARRALRRAQGRLPPLNP